MQFIVWKDEHSVGEPRMDAHHQEIFACINRVYEGSAGREEEKVVLEALDRLKNYTTSHFRAEEQLLERTGYARLAQQRAAHASYVGRIEMMERALKMRRAVDAHDLMQLLKDWIIEHILKEDRLYSEHLRRVGGSR